MPQPNKLTSAIGFAMKAGKLVSGDFSTEKAARSGQPVALGKLGLMHFYGLGAQEDHAEAARWFRQAADAGNADAALILAEMYRQGDGVGANRSEAYLWYSVAGELGKDEARTPRQQLAAGMPPEQALELLAHTLTNRLLHAPTVALREAALSGDGELGRAAEKLFPAAARDAGDA